MDSSFELLDAIMGGDLGHWLCDRRAAGHSFRRIARDLSGDGVEINGRIVKYHVSYETVRRWCERAGIRTTAVMEPAS